MQVRRPLGARVTEVVRRRRALHGRGLELGLELMQVLARACGHTHLNQFAIEDLTTWKREMAYLTGIQYGGVSLD